MSAGKKELLCSKCRKRVSYQILKRPAKAFIKDLEIEYEEYYGICDECGEELYIPGIDDQNEAKIEQIFREKKGLITIPEIMMILEKYNIEKRPLSKLLGFGELTITRYIDGQLPSKKYSDILYGILMDEQKMKKIALENKEAVSTLTFDKVLQAILKCEEEKQFSNSAERIALYVIYYGKEITNLLLQKVLYYVKAISHVFNGFSIIPESCEAWRLGPVFPTVYDKYKEFGKQEIKLNLSGEYIQSLLTEEEKEIVNFVLNTFGIYNAWFLRDLTHKEEPWITARGDLDESDASKNVIEDKLIYEFFKRVNGKFNLKTFEGIDLYVNEMRKRIYTKELI